MRRQLLGMHVNLVVIPACVLDDPTGPIAHETQMLILVLLFSVVPGTDKLLEETEKFVQSAHDKMAEMTSDIEDDFLRLLETLQMEQQPNQVSVAITTNPKQQLCKTRSLGNQHLTPGRLSKSRQPE